MFKHIATKLAATLFVLAPLALTTGCGESILGLDGSQSVAEKAQTEFPKILPVEYAPFGADLTGDGMVDASDMAAFASMLTADLNGDRVVDGQDQALMEAVLVGGPIDRYKDGYVDASDLAAFARARAHADLTGDGYVSASDLAAFVSKLHTGDVNGDGAVNSEDLEVIRKNVGHTVTPTGIALASE